jgi:FKBP-type peptidyl-prolyl cis-trans isomerase FkpA
VAVALGSAGAAAMIRGHRTPSLKHIQMKLLQLVSLSCCLITLSASAAMAATPAPETLPNGVIVKHTREGKGNSPAATDIVQVNYRGKLADGTEFDSSYKRGTPTSFPLGGVIPCWTAGLQKMKVGGAATLTCPPATAYGARGAAGVVPPNATLTFDVELLSVTKQ